MADGQFTSLPIPLSYIDASQIPISASGISSLNVEDAVAELAQDVSGVEVNGVSLPGTLYAQNITSKNLLRPAVEAVNGITITIGSDGTLTVSGTASASVTIVCGVLSPELSGQSCVLSGCPSGGDAYSYSLRAFDGDTVIATDNGSGATFTATANTTIRIRLYGGYTASSVVFAPMVRLATVTDSTYVPFAFTGIETSKALVTKPLRSGKTVPITFATNARTNCMIAISGLGTTVNGLFLVSCGTGGSVYVTEINKGTNISYTTDSYELSISNTSGAADSYMGIFVFNGDIS